MNINYITSIISFLLFLLLVFFFAITLAVRYRKRKQENEDLRAKLAMEHLKVEAEIQEETLQHISRELHDNLGHIASLIKINLNTIDLNNGEAEDKIEFTKDLTRQLIGDLKQLSVRLSANPIVQDGLLAAVKKETERLNKTGILKARLISEGDIPLMEQDKALILYRMVQECINNIIKHSEAENVTIKLAYADKCINLALCDDGKGFDMDKQSNRGGAGLYNLKNRGELLNASLDVYSKPGHGTTITILMPYS